MKVMLMIALMFLFMSCTPEKDLSSGEIVCDSYVQCDEGPLSYDECLNMKIKTMFPNMNGTAFGKLTIGELEHGQRFNECLLDVEICDRWKGDHDCAKYDEFDYDLYGRI